MRTNNDDTATTAEEEDDWSHLLSDGNRFQQHPIATVSFHTQAQHVALHIRSVASLSPLDMMNLSCGTEDATGHRIWMGARFFLECIAHLWGGTRRFLPHPKHMLELGCGTGLSGIAVVKYCCRRHWEEQWQEGGQPEQREEKQNGGLLRRAILTDNAEDCLELAHKNIQHNLSEEMRHVTVEAHCLQWVTDASTMVPDAVQCAFDTVIATDVIYDCGAVVPLLRSAHGCLQDGGVFVLSHVPRAALPCDEGKVYTTIHEYILDVAAPLFVLDRVVRPLDVLSAARTRDGQETTTVGTALPKREGDGHGEGRKDTTADARTNARQARMEEWQSAGAELLIFRKERTTKTASQ